MLHVLSSTINYRELSCFLRYPSPVWSKKKNKPNRSYRRKIVTKPNRWGSVAENAVPVLRWLRHVRSWACTSDTKNNIFYAGRISGLRIPWANHQHVWLVAAFVLAVLATPVCRRVILRVSASHENQPGVFRAPLLGTFCVDSRLDT